MNNLKLFVDRLNAPPSNYDWSIHDEDGNVILRENDNRLIHVCKPEKLVSLFDALDSDDDDVREAAEISTIVCTGYIDENGNCGRCGSEEEVKWNS